MAKIKYKAAEQTLGGTHVVYAVPQPAGTLTFDELCDEACEDNTYSPEEMKGCVGRFMKTVQRQVQRGWRCQLGEQFLFIYPNLQLSVKDYTDPKTGQLIVATAKMLNAQNGKSRLGCSVSPKFSQQFAQNVSWTKVDGQGNPTDDEDVTDGATSSDTTTQQPATSGPVLTISKQGAGQAAVTDQTGQPVSSGATLTAGQTLTLTVTPAAGKTPTATLGTTALTLTEDEGQYTVTFQMPAESATLTVVTSPGDNEGD